MKDLELKDTTSEVLRAARGFIVPAGSGLYVLGTNKYGERVAAWAARQGWALKAFIDDRAAGGTFGSIPVVGSNEVPAGSSLVNCIVEGRAIEGRNNLLALGPVSYADYFSLQVDHPGELPEIDFLDHTDTIPGDLEKYRQLYSRLHDEASRTTLRDLLNFRWNRDIRFLENFTFRLNEQYFEPFVVLGKGSVFVDGGGFDGATTRHFARLHPDHGEIFYFEPNERSFADSRERLTGVPGVRFFEKGLWHERTTLHFDNSMGSASKVTGAGSTTIGTTAIDLEVDGRIDMIKLDIEGAELNALRGAERSIRAHHPVLAVCVYHDQQDLWRVPELVLSYHPGYQVYLRHYTQGVFETVMYFV